MIYVFAVQPRMKSHVCAAAVCGDVEWKLMGTWRERNVSCVWLNVYECACMRKRDEGREEKWVKMIAHLAILLSDT